MNTKTALVTSAIVLLIVVVGTYALVTMEHKADDKMVEGDVVIGDYVYHIEGNEAYLMFCNATYTDVHIDPYVEYEGKAYPVTTIDEGAFMDRILADIYFPETVTTVVKLSFDNVVADTIYIPATLTNIHMEAFSVYVDRFVVDTSNQYYRDFEGCLFTKNLESMLSYNNNDPRTSFSIPDGTRYLSPTTFIDFNRLTELDLPSSLKKVSGALFRYLSLKSIDVDDSNIHMRSIDGILFTKDCNEIISYPKKKAGTEYIIPEGVSVIGEYAFFATGLLHIGIPDTVRMIGAYAFSFNAFQQIVIPAGVTEIGAHAFESCLMLSSISLPSTIETIGMGAFAKAGIEEIHIPASVRTIDAAVFNHCPNLERIVVDDGNKDFMDLDGILYTADGSDLIKYPPIRASTEFVVPDSVTRISDFAFEYALIGKLTIGPNVEYLGHSVCSDSLIETAIINANVDTIPMDTFYCCVSLSTVVLSDSIRTLESYSFANCQSLRSLNLGNLVNIMLEALEHTSIEELVIPKTLKIFEQCTDMTDLVSIVVDRANPYFRSVDGVLYDKEMTTLIKYPEMKVDSTFIVPASVTSLSEYAFYTNRQLEHVELPHGLVDVGKYAFSRCSALTSVSIPDTVASISTCAFCECYSLRTVELGASVAEIGDYAFYGCDNLETIVFSMVTMPSMGTDAFWIGDSAHPAICVVISTFQEGFLREYCGPNVSFMYVHPKST